MFPSRAVRRPAARLALLTLLLMPLAGASLAQSTGQTAAPPPSRAADDKASLEIYGFAQLDAIADFNRNDPNWFDVNRPSRLPNSPDQFGKDGHFYVTARQTRFGVRGETGQMKSQFEFDLFGVGPDAGQTTLRLRQAWGQWKQVGAGQTNSQFMDQDVYPNVLVYWAPNGMLLLRNPQVFWEPYRDGDSRARIAIENPGARGDAGQLADRVELQNVNARFPAPDVTGHYRLAGKWGYAQLGGALRYIAYDDTLPDQFNLSGHVWGWGVSASAGLKPTAKDLLHLQLIEGAGVATYFNDAPVDVGAKLNPGNPLTPVVGQALHDFGLVVYLDHTWNPRWSSSVGYSRVDISNSDLQLANALKTGQYASGNLLATPAPNVIICSEFQWARRQNFADGFRVNDFRLQFSFKYSFSYKLGG